VQVVVDDNDERRENEHEFHANGDNGVQPPDASSETTTNNKAECNIRRTEVLISTGCDDPFVSNESLETAMYVICYSLQSLILD
jgi:hypothetical protein